MGIKRRYLGIARSSHAPPWRGSVTAVCTLLAVALTSMPATGGATPDSSSPQKWQETGKDTQAEKDDAGAKKQPQDEEKPKADQESDDKPEAGGKSEHKEGTAPGDKAEEKSGEEGAESKSKGFKFELKEQGEGWANLTGGIKRGTSYNGLTTGTVDIDLEKAAGWKGGRFFVSAFDIHGHGPTRSLVGNNQIVSNTEATPSLKLYDLWLDQKVPGRLSIRFGQEGANDEMMVSAHAALYLNSSFGFPGLPATDLPSGGPNYPLATPFVRVRWRASDQLALVGAVFNGDPAPPGGGDPQIRDLNGTAFRLNDHTLAFAEAKYFEDLDAPDKLQTNYKVGVWYDTAPFADQRLDNAGGLLASPASSGVPRTHSGDFAVYGIVDQILWRREGTNDQGIGVFLHVQGGPADRNLADWFVAGGMNWNGPFLDRPDDIAGLAVSYLGISPAAQRFSQDLVSFGRLRSAYASNETVIEATYQAPVTKWLTLQPDAQLVLNPNANIPNTFGRVPHSPALVIGLRVTVKLSNEN